MYLKIHRVPYVLCLFVWCKCKLDWGMKKYLVYNIPMNWIKQIVNLQFYFIFYLCLYSLINLFNWYLCAYIYIYNCILLVRQLLHMVEKDDSVELDFDIFEPSMSAFTELFNEKEKMQVNDIMKSTQSICLL